MDHRDMDVVPSKRVCRVETPESFKIKGNGTSTPVRNVVKNLSSFFSEGDAAPSHTHVKISVPPRFNFMKRSFISFLERTRSRRGILVGITKCVHECEYSAQSNTITVTFKSADAAKAMSQLGKMSYMNNSIEFLNVEEGENDESVYLKGTVMEPVILSDDEMSEQGLNDNGDSDVEYVPDGLNHSQSNNIDEVVQTLSQSIHDTSISADINQNVKAEAFDFSADLLARSVTLSNLQEGFSLDSLRSILHSMIVKEGLCSKETESILVVYRETADKALVECLEPYFADFLVNQKTLFFMKREVSIAPRTKECDYDLTLQAADEVYPVNIVRPPDVKLQAVQGAVCPVNTESPADVTLHAAVNKVCLKNLKKGFPLDYLHYTLKQLIEEGESVCSNDDPISEISVVEGGAGALVELSKEKFANSLLLKKSFLFMGEKVDIVAAVQNKIFLANLDKDFPTDFLCYTLNILLAADGVCEKGKNCVVEVAQESGTAVVELTEDKFAQCLLKKSSFNFMGRSISVECEINKNGGECATSENRDNCESGENGGECATSENRDNCESGENGGECATSENRDNGDSSENCGDSSVSLINETFHSNDIAAGFRSDWTAHSEAVLLKLMLANRHLLVHSSTHKRGDGFKNVRNSLLESRLQYGERALRRRMKALPMEPPPELEQAANVFNNSMSSKEDVEDQINALSTLIPSLKRKDNPPSAKKTISLTPGNKIVEQFIVVPEDFSPSDVTPKFTYKSDKLLIAEYYRMKGKFEDAKHRSSEVYGEILKVMHLKGYTNLVARDLPRRMSALASEFRMRKDRLKNTGNSSSDLKWCYWDDMELIWEGSVVHDPQKTRSMGSSHETEVRMKSGTVKVPSKVSKFLQPMPRASKVNNRDKRIEDLNTNVANMIQLIAQRLAAEKK